MDPLQADHERAVGDRLINALNSFEGSTFRFLSRGDEAPDLIYSDGTIRLGIEVGTAYYHSKDAEVLWKAARGTPDAPTSWGDSSEGVSKWCVEPDARFLNSIQELLEQKSIKAYGSNVWLLIPVYPNITNWEEFETLVGDLVVPPNQGFKRIFIAGRFPFSMNPFTGEIKSRAAYRILQIFPSHHLIYTEPIEWDESALSG